MQRQQSPRQDAVRCHVPAPGIEHSDRPEHLDPHTVAAVHRLHSEPARGGPRAGALYANAVPVVVRAVRAEMAECLNGGESQLQTH